MSVTGRLIEMTTRMVTTPTARITIIIGIVSIALGIIVGIPRLMYKNNFLLLFCIVFVVFGLCMALYGDSIPKQQQILACADGPVSLDTISASYDIIDIDGSLITMVRR